MNELLIMESLSIMRGKGTWVKDHFQSRGQELFKSLLTKKKTFHEKELNPHKIILLGQLDRRFIVSGHRDLSTILLSLVR